MIRKEVVKQLIKEYQEDLNIQETTKRELKIRQEKGFATIISGIRRCGKSTLAKQLTKNKKTYYFHFENVQLANFEQEDFHQLDEAFREVLGEDGIYLLDEVQNIQGWEVFVRQLTEKKLPVIITGSNATMLSRELGTRLTGRNLRYELFPFSYKEFLNFKKIKDSEQSFEQFFLQGGFPEYLATNNKDILRNLFQDILYRDIIVRNDLRSEQAIKEFVAFISANIGVETSFNNITKHITVKSTNTILQFMDSCEQAYLFFAIKKFSYSVRKQQMNPKKIYCIDNALIRTNTVTFSENKGRMLENLVFIELRRKNKNIFYHKNNYECDFLIQENNKIIQAIQVCYKLTRENEEREMQGIIEACKENKLTKGLILTYDEEDSIKKEGINIIIMPVRKWLLKDKK